MSKNKDVILENLGKIFAGLFFPTPMKLLVGMMGYSLNSNSDLWALVDYILGPIVLCKWIWYHQITLVAVKSAFPWFFV